MSSGGVPNRRNTVRTFIINIPLRLPRSQTSNPHSRDEGRHIKTLMKHSPSTTLVNVNPRRDFSLRWLQHVKAAVYRHIPRTCYSCNIHRAVRRIDKCRAHGRTSSIYSRPFFCVKRQTRVCQKLSEGYNAIFTHAPFCVKRQTHVCQKLSENDPTILCRGSGLVPNKLRTLC